MKNVLVSGANGFIGTNLVKLLAESGCYVYAVDYHFTQVFECSNNICMIECDLMKSQRNLYSLVEKSIDCIIHLAWAGTSGNSRGDMNLQLENIRMACELIETAKKINCSRVLYASSISEVEAYEYLMTDNCMPSLGYIYGTAKLTAHLMAETYAFQKQIEFIPILISNIYGAGEKSARLINSAIRKLLKKERCSFTTGNQMYDFIYVTDAIASIAAIADRGKGYNLYYVGGGNPKPLKYYLNTMRDIVAPEEELGLGDLKFHGTNLNYQQFDLQKVEKDTGYKNKISFEDGIKLTTDYIRRTSKNVEE